MSFANGSVSFRQFLVIGQAPESPQQDQIERLTSRAFVAADLVVEPVEYGWSGGGHLYDAAFSFEKNVYADCLFFALRVDTNKAPSNVVRSYTAMEEAAVAATNPSGFLTKIQKREVKESVARKVEEEEKAGKYRRSRTIPVLWDMATGRLLAQVGGANFEKLAEIFEWTFGLELLPLTAGAIAERVLLPLGKRREFEDLRQSRFATGPFGDAPPPEYPWVAKSADARAFLGNEFLLWALWRAREGDDEVGGTALMFDRKLDLECAFGATGKHAIKGSAPDRLSEVHEAMRSGKLPRKAGVTAIVAREQYEFTFDPEAFAFAGVKLPNVDDAETPRALFEERVRLIRDLTKGVEAAYAEFLGFRVSNGWASVRGDIVNWIGGAVGAGV